MSARTFRAAIARLDTPSSDGRILVNPTSGRSPFPHRPTRVTLGYFEAAPSGYGCVVGEVNYHWISESGKLCVAGELFGTEVGNEALTLLRYRVAALTFDVESYGGTFQSNPADGTGAYHVLREWYVRQLVVGPPSQCWKLAPLTLEVDLRDVDLWTNTRTREEVKTC